MRKVAKFASSLGCLTSVVGPLLELLLYPRANWLFVFVLIGVEVLILNSVLAEDPRPQALADDIERLLTGNYGRWEVDDFESCPPRNPQLLEFWRRSMEVGGLPEEWLRLNEEKKNRLREIVRELRELGEAREKGAGQRRST
jgi:hypothetical protein